ncbi:MAG: hypothetical protein IJT65_06295 [Eubacterium sp.]|nr:hypothetical protein [Eubacterium sp.]
MNIGVGRAYVVKSLSEASRLKAALEAQKEEYTRLFESIKENEGKIFFWYIALLEDETLLSKLLGCINRGYSAESAVIRTFDGIIQDFKSNENTVIRERTEDLHDIKDALIKRLSKEKRIDFSAVPKGSVLVTKSITPSAVCNLKKDKISAIVTNSGSLSSHTAILAKARGIPIVTAAKNFNEIQTGDILIVNTERKTVIIEKTESRPFL